MGKRGRPRHPDVLTPREWEVLGLVRGGLSNDAIAARLGISLDGVKYHVSEILGKLGLENRTDAARWAEEPSRPRAWSGALAPLAFLRRLPFGWASGVAAAVAVAAIVAGLTVLIWAVASEGGRAVPARLEGLTAENFAARVAEAMSAEGMVYHVVSEQYQQFDQRAAARNSTVEAWIDFAGARTREDVRAGPAGSSEDIPEHLMSIAVNDTQYSYDGTESTSEQTQTCAGVTFYVAISLPLLCDGAIDEADLANATLDLNAAYEGTPAVALSFESEIAGFDNGNETRLPINVTYYAHRDTLLPLARVSEIHVDTGLIRTAVATDTYGGELIDRSELPDSFFDPAAIGYTEG
ncbi:MAG: helix-turn-helix transcriptional regulator [Dehalococcoidia bacterium]